MGRAPVTGRSAREESQRAPKATDNELLSVTLQRQVDDLKAQIQYVRRACACVYQEGERRKWQVRPKQSGAARETLGSGIQDVPPPREGLAQEWDRLVH